MSLHVPSGRGQSRRAAHARPPPISVSCTCRVCQRRGEAGEGGSSRDARAGSWDGRRHCGDTSVCKRLRAFTRESRADNLTMAGGRPRRAHTRAHTSVVRAFTRDWLQIFVRAHRGQRRVAPSGCCAGGVKRTCVVLSSFVLTNLDRRVISCQNRRKLQREDM